MTKRILILLLCCCVVLSLCGCADSKHTEPPLDQVPTTIKSGYDTPAALMEAFCKTIQQQDIDAAIQLFGCDLQAEKVDYKAYLTAQGSWLNLSDGHQFPQKNQVFTAGNALQLKGSAAHQIENLLFSLNGNTEKYKNIVSAGTATKDDVARWSAETYYDISEACSIPNPESFRMKEMVSSALLNDTTVMGLCRLSNQANILGAEKYLECAVLYEYNSNSYIGGVSLVSYDGCWYIYRLTAAIEDASAFGYVYRISVQDYVDKYKSKFADNVYQIVIESDNSYKLDETGYDVNNLGPYIDSIIDKLSVDGRSCYKKKFLVERDLGNLDDRIYDLLGVSEEMLTDEWIASWVDTLFYYFK